MTTTNTNEHAYVVLHNFPELNSRLFKSLKYAIKGQPAYFIDSVIGFAYQLEYPNIYFLNAINIFTSEEAKKHELSSIEEKVEVAGETGPVTPDPIDTVDTSGYTARFAAEFDLSKAAL